MPITMTQREGTGLVGTQTYDYDEVHLMSEMRTPPVSFSAAGLEDSGQQGTGK